jgi:hypothetical protein
MKTHRFAAAVLLAATVVPGCTIHGSTSPGGGPPPPGGEPPPPPASAEQAVTVEEVRDESGNVYQISQGARGEPTEVGCADGQREAFVDAAAFPSIAGCLGSWQGTQSMRSPASGIPCGDDRGECAVPGDLCAQGWRVCGATGSIADLTQVSGEQCEQAGGGRFSAAISHCETQNGCAYDTRPDGDYECFDRGWCSETVCCGADCGNFGACRDGVWQGLTHIAQGTDQGCGATSSRRAGGVLCCR